MKKALILTDGYLDRSTAKTSHGLLRYSTRYDITAVIDYKFTGSTTDEVVSHCKSVPIYGTVEEALKEVDAEILIVGVATIGGFLPDNFRVHVIAAIHNGLDIISGLHHYLNDDLELSELALQNGVVLTDIRRSPPLEELHYFNNRKKEVGAKTVAFMGTDSSIGKRTALIAVYEELKKHIDVEWVATGQTGLLQGTEYGLPLDSTIPDYMVGELEYQIWRAWKDHEPDVILVEGQGSISHPAYVCGSRAVLAASQPDGIVLQHSPGRKYRHYREDEIRWPMPTAEEEIQLLEMFSGSKVIALGLNPEKLTKEEVTEWVKRYESELGIPTADALAEPGKLAKAMIDIV